MTAASKGMWTSSLSVKCLLRICSFCRKTTMVKHQRRSHQRGIHSSELDDGDTSDSDSGESPTTPEHHSQIQWLQNGQPSTSHSLIQHTSGHAIHRAHSFNDFGHQHVNGYGIAQPYGHKHSNSGGSPSYNDVSAAQEQIHPHMVVPGAPMHQHTYYIPEQGNPGVATMNTNPNVSIRQYQVAPHNQLRRSASYPPQNGASVQSSPGTYSSTSSRSPAPQEGYYTHHTVQQTSAYNSQNTSPIDQQPMMQYQQQAPAMPQAPQHNLVSSAPLITQVPTQYQHVSQDQHWMAYQEPVQVSPAHCGDTLYNPWVEKIDSYDIQHALPSMRIETL